MCQVVPDGRLCGNCAQRAAEAYEFSTALSTRSAPPLSEKIRALRRRLHELTQKIDVFIVVGGPGAGSSNAYSEEDIIMVEKDALAAATAADDEDLEHAKNAKGDTVYQCSVCPMSFQVTGRSLLNTLPHRGKRSVGVLVSVNVRRSARRSTACTWRRTPPTRCTRAGRAARSSRTGRRYTSTRATTSSCTTSVATSATPPLPWVDPVRPRLARRRALNSRSRAEPVGDAAPRSVVPAALPRLRRGVLVAARAERARGGVPRPRRSAAVAVPAVLPRLPLGWSPVGACAAPSPGEAVRVRLRWLRAALRHQVRPLRAVSAPTFRWIGLADEVGAVAGATWWRTFARRTRPSCRPSLRRPPPPRRCRARAATARQFRFSLALRRARWTKLH